MRRPSGLKGPASAGPFRVSGVLAASGAGGGAGSGSASGSVAVWLAVVLVLVVSLSTGGCKIGKSRSEAEGPGGLPKRLGAEPAIVDPSGHGPASGVGGTTDTLPGPDGQGGPAPSTAATSAPQGSTGTTAPPPAPFRNIASVGDGTRDAGLEAPPYDDIVSVKVDDNGTSVRFTVEFAAAVPARLPDGEIMGVGVDVFHGGRESAYQVFAEGSASDGWLAYLQVGEKFVKYRGTFELAGSRLVFAVPWGDVGGRAPGTVAAFADWSRDGAVIASVGADKAPDRGATPFTP